MRSECERESETIEGGGKGLGKRMLVTRKKLRRTVGEANVEMAGGFSLGI